MKFDDLLESYNKQINEQTAVPMPGTIQKNSSNMAVPMPGTIQKNSSNMAVPMPGLNKQSTKPQSQFKNTTPMERMKDLWDLLIATQTDDQINVKRILTKYGMTYMPKTTGP